MTASTVLTRTVQRYTGSQSVNKLFFKSSYVDKLSRRRTESPYQLCYECEKHTDELQIAPFQVQLTGLSMGHV